MSLVALRNAYVQELVTELAWLETYVGNPVTVITHEGPFDEDTLERCSAKAPAVVVAIDRVSTSIEGGIVVGAADMLATCITKNLAGVTRDVGGLILVKEVLRILGRFVPQEEGARRAEAFVARNFYTEKVAKKGCVLWGVGFRARLDFAPEGGRTYDDLLEVYASYDLAPTDGAYEAEDQIDLPGLGED